MQDKKKYKQNASNVPTDVRHDETKLLRLIACTI